MDDNIYKFSDRAAIEQEAREWLIMLDSETPLADGEVKALREWLGRNPAHWKELKRIFKFWDRANILTELAVPLQEVESHRPISLFSGGWLSLLTTRRIVVMMSVTLLTMTIAFISWDNQKTDITRINGIYGTAVGQQLKIVLADGSTVEINTESQVQVDYGEQTRNIRLLRGEAHFGVAHDPDRPFKVFAGRTMVRAVGTAFSVYLNSDDVKVTVTEGQINLHAAKSDPVVTTIAPSEDVPELEELGSLSAGQTATFSGATNKIEMMNLLAEQELQRQISWREGYLVFAGEPLSEVVAELNRYSPFTIRIADPELESLPVGGRFKVRELGAIFEVLKSSFGVQVVQLSDRDIQLQLQKDQ